jgi:RNA polymerase sigma-70 factor, ECF subfamily
MADGEGAFDRIFQGHRDPVFAYLVGRTGDREEARDLLQETFLRAWRNAPTLEELEPRRQRAWLFTVARNLLTDTYRGRAVRAEAAAHLARAGDGTAPPDEEPAARAEAAERMARLQAAIRDLPEDWRVPLVMQTLGGLNSTEIGALLGDPPGTVRYRLSMARNRLAERLASELQEDPR